MQFSTVVSTVTREAIVPKIYDTILSGNVGLLRILGNSKPWKSGIRYDVPIKYVKSTTGGLVPVGGELDTTRQNTRVKMQFEVQRIHKPVVIDDIELAVNEGDERVLDLLQTETESIAQDLGDDLGSYLYTGTSATGSSFDSLLNAADDSTNFSTYGALARATYTTIKGYYVASIGEISLAEMATAYDAVEIGNDQPSMLLTTPAVWSDYETLLQPTVRAGYQMNGYPKATRTGVISGKDALRGDIGFDSVYYRGTPMVKDEKCTSQKLFLVNEKYFFFAGMNLPNYKKINITGNNVEGPQALPIPRGFNWSGLLRSTNQPAQVGHLYYVGNFISTNPRLIGQMTGIT